jgi:exodeoxyribonuclease III
MVKLATWNINGTKARLDVLLAWLGQAAPEIVCLQELKCIDENFPRSAIEDLGYNIETHGQKSFNGVAILSKLPFDEVSRGLPGDDNDEQSRFIEAMFSAGGKALRIASIYLPNGNPVDSEKFSYKLAWLARLDEWIRNRLELEEPMAVAGDYNVIPSTEDCHDPEAWRDDALFMPQSRSAFRQLIHSGMVDTLRSISDSSDLYTYWDYQAGAWQKNNGIRIDHILLSPELAGRASQAGIDKHVRAWEKPSDHVPVWVKLDL